MSAILFGSISTLADTSELQRASFNKAFVVHDLGWTWSQNDYQQMLDTSGGADRIAYYARSWGEIVDAQAVHHTKSQIFQRDVSAAHLQPRPQVAAVLTQARAMGVAVGLVTTTSRQNISALLGGLDPHVTAEMFDVIVNADDVDNPKPAADAYHVALQRLNEQARHCVAIEDNTDGVTAAHCAGLTCLAFPNQNTAGHDFTHAEQQVNQVVFDDVVALIPGD